MAFSPLPVAHQPTLTQILGGSKNKLGNEKPLEADCGNDAKVTNTLNVHGTSGDGDGAFLAFWDDSMPEEEDEKRLGSMAYFNRAAAKFKAIGCGECVREGPDVLSVISSC